MNGWLALILAIIGAAVAALAAIIVAGGAVLGVLWLFVFGDDPWAPWVEELLNFALPITGLGVWAVFVWVIWDRLTVPREAG